MGDIFLSRSHMEGPTYPKHVGAPSPQGVLIKKTPLLRDFCLPETVLKQGHSDIHLDSKLKGARDGS